MVGIALGTNCVSLLADLLLHAFYADLIEGLLKKKDRNLTQIFNSSFRYIDDDLC